MDDGISLLDALREELGCRSVKDGCSPQGQCGCCTVWVDGAPRVACVTPVRRIAGRQVTTLEGAPEELRDRWAAAFVAHGASQCGFCTPGIVLRLAALEGAGSGRPSSRQAIEAALRAHLCRCTGWQSIVDAACSALGVDGAPSSSAGDPGTRCWPGGAPRSRDRPFRARGPRWSSAAVASPTTRRHPTRSSNWARMDRLPTGLRAARAGSGRVQGRNSTVPLSHPVEVPDGDWALTLQTTWLEPAYVEPDASWSRPGQLPASPLANGGAFGGKRHSPVPATARGLADASGDTVRVLWRREDVVRRGPKRPPLAIALRADGTGVVRVACTKRGADLEPLVARVRTRCPGVEVEMVDVAGPPVSSDLRGAGWAEVLAARAVLAGSAGLPATAPRGGAGSMSPFPVGAAPASTSMSEVRAGARSTWTCGRARSSVP